LAKHTKGQPLYDCGNWFYYPWLRTVIHFLPDAMHQELRTGRNRNLITSEEQKKFYQSTIGCLGMSVGSHVALTIVMTGGGGTIKLADPDVISGSNLNRIRTGFPNLEVPKTVAVARQITEINPYNKIHLYQKGVDDKILEEFLSRPKLDVLVEETDQPYIKIKARFLAKKYKVPVIMAADNGDNTIVDVERFDLNSKRKILHGIVGSMRPEDVANVSPGDLPKVIARIAGANMAVPRMLESVREVGKSLYSWPQLGTAASLCGVVLAYIARKITVGDKVRQGRFDVSIEKFFDPSYEQNIRKRDNLLKYFK
jgi:tRNA threonylcarbamoyladenosine dehydratase